MNVVDSSGWLEFFAAGPNADFFAPALQAVDELLVPSVSIYEVFERVLQQRGEGLAIQAVALMQQGSILDLSASGAVAAARLAVDAGLPMADAIILSAARTSGAAFWTQDAHFEGMEGVEYVSARSD